MICTNYQNQNEETKKAVESGEDIFQLLFLLKIHQDYTEHTEI